MNTDIKIKSARRLLMILIVSLFLSGLSAMPVDAELQMLENIFSHESWAGYWVLKVHAAFNEVSDQHPFLFYGYDWLAFAHFVLAIPKV